MDVVSTCPLRVASIVWRPRAGAWALTIVCKATFRLEPGVCVLAEAQEDPADGDAYRHDDPERSVRAADDLVPFKPRADVLLVGHAFAPGGQPARVLSARMVVGEVDKSVEVWCDRIFWHDGQVLEGQLFARMPLCYELAAFGPSNPVGVRFDATPDAHGAVPLPNLQPPGLRVARRGDAFGPIGFGPFGPRWPTRAEKLRRHAAEWSTRAWREQPLPADIDAGYFNAAPFDQQVDAIEVDQRIVLENLHAEHARLETRLPGLRPAARMVAGGRAGESIALAADTLCIDTDRRLVTVVWRGRVPLGRPEEEGRVVVSMEAARAGASEGTVLFGGEGYAGATLDIGLGDGKLEPTTSLAEAPAEGATRIGVRHGGPALPFGAAKSPWAGVIPAGPTVSNQVPAETGTIYGVTARAHDVLPAPWNAARPKASEVILEAATAPEPISEPAQALHVVEPVGAAEEPQIKEISVERCAAIRAAIDRRGGEKAAILDQDGLSPETWEGVERRWESEMDAQIERGRTDLLDRFDAAYVAQIESERGSIRVDEYVRLMIAAERGTTEAVLVELSLPEEAEMRLERVWMGKTFADPALSRALRKAILGARLDVKRS